MTDLFTILIRGLVFGSLAGINSLGIVLLWRTTRLVNLAQPSMGLVGGALTGLLVTSGKWNFWLALPVGLAMGALLGLAADRIVLRRLRQAPRAVLLVATVALAQIYGAMQSALPLAFGGSPPTFQLSLPFDFTLARVPVTGAEVLALLVFPLTLAATWWFLYRSRFGLAALALGQDTERAQSLGIPAAVVRSSVWAVAGLLSSVSAILTIPILGYSLGGRLGATVLLLPLAPAVFAGLRSLVGAAGAALGVGISYYAALNLTHSDGPKSELIIAIAVVLGLALQGRRLGRGETAGRASSWEAAATPRPLPWVLARSEGLRTIAMLLGFVAIGAALLLPRFLGPGQDVEYATTAAFALGALAVSVAWMFAGEVAIGHWGIAGLVGVLTLYLPGPWWSRAVVAGALASVVTGALGIASRRRSSLSFAVIGLAAAAGASIAATTTGDRAIAADPATVGRVLAVVTLVAAIGIAKLRASKFGARLVAARDDPERCTWFGIDPLRARAISLAISGGLVGLAGSLYVSFFSTGLGTASSQSAGAFDSRLSLDLLSMAVIGGLGSPFGAVVGAVVLQTSKYLLPGWGALLTSGLGVLLVLIFLPGGIGRAIVAIRDVVARLFSGPAETPAIPERAEPREAVPT